MNEIKSFLHNHLPKQLTQKLKTLRSYIRQKKRNQHTEITQKDLEEYLISAGIHKGDILILHSSLSKLGNIKGGAETLISAIKNIITNQGTLLMPTYSAAIDVLEDAKKGVFIDLRTARSVTGKITEVFRCMPNTIRSSHPFSSICAWGKDAQYICSGHSNDPRICHKDSPLGRLFEKKGKILGLGVSLGPVSFYHVLEDTWDSFPLQPYLPEETITYIDSSGQKITRAIQRYNPEISKTRIDMPDSTGIRKYLTQHMKEKKILQEFPFAETTGWVMQTNLLYQELKILAQQDITIYSKK